MFSLDPVCLRALAPLVVLVIETDLVRNLVAGSREKMNNIDVRKLAFRLTQFPHFFRELSIIFTVVGRR